VITFKKKANIKHISFSGEAAPIISIKPVFKGYKHGIKK